MSPEPRFSRSATGDERSVLTDFAPLRVHAAASRCAVGLTTSDPAWRGQSQEMCQNSVDTISVIQVEGRSTLGTEGS